MKVSLIDLKKELRSLSDTEKAKSSARFFKTGYGDYGEGDVFMGVTVPEHRRVAKKYLELSLDNIENLLHSREHEFRFSALIILVNKFKKAEKQERKKIYDFYFRNTKWVNSWDLVDSSAPYIVGLYLDNKYRIMLFRLAKSQLWWERRIAIISTFYHIRQGNLELTFQLTEFLLKDKHDLIHKAVGWMLREAGKRSAEAEEKFLDKHATEMPRTMLRYAIEKFPEKKRQYYLKLK